MNYKKNDSIEAVIDGFGNEGEGIARIDGFPFFIKDAIPGDRVRAVVMKVKKNHAYARLVSVLEPSIDRIEPECPVSKSCGGCTLQHASYEAELKFKEDKVYNCLLRIGGISAEVLDRAYKGIEGLENPFRYRNKAQYPVGRDKEGRAVAGFYAGRTHSIIPQDDCVLSPPEFKTVLRTVLDFLDEYKIPVYDEASGTGLIRHVLIRKGFNTGEIMTCIVSCARSIPGLEILAGRLMEISGMKSVCLNINPDRTNVILGKECIPVSGPMYIEDILCGLRFRISPLSFYQVNPVMAEKLYGTALEYAGIKDLTSGSCPEEVWDVCCGIGTISLAAASLSGECFVHGVEIVPEAVNDAKENAAINGIKNVDFVAAAAEEYLPSHFAKNPEERADVVILDPPRKGMDIEALKTVINLSPERIVYVSCDPATLARDLKVLIGAGFILRKYKVFDQFCRSGHVETCCVLERLRNAKDHISFTLDMEDYYRIKDVEAEKKNDSTN